MQSGQMTNGRQPEPVSVTGREAGLPDQRDHRGIGGIRAADQRPVVQRRYRSHPWVRGYAAAMGLRHLPGVAVLTKRVLLLVNPGSRRGARRQRDAQSAFDRRGVACDVMLTERPGHAAELAGQRASDFDAVFTLGGDGTVMEVIGALAHSAIPIGVLPGGTGNLIARVLGIPLDVAGAVDALVDGDDAQIDLGSIDGHRFAFAAGVWTSAARARSAGAGDRRRRGCRRCSG